MRNWIDNVFSPGCQIGDSSRHPLSLFGSLFPQPEDSGCGFYLLCLLGWSAAGFGADIRSTMHNLTRKGLTVAAEEVCVFCHTPQLSPGPAGRSVVGTASLAAVALELAFVRNLRRYRAHAVW
jgi:hypothetical protein